MEFVPLSAVGQHLVAETDGVLLDLEWVHVVMTRLLGRRVCILALTRSLRLFDVMCRPPLWQDDRNVEALADAGAAFCDAAGKDVDGVGHAEGAGEDADCPTTFVGDSVIEVLGGKRRAVCTACWSILVLLVLLLVLLVLDSRDDGNLPIPEYVKCGRNTDVLEALETIELCSNGAVFGSFDECSIDLRSKLF